ncbi:MAG: IclR family transcriptional regulator [Reyranellaceae bacterium]
MKADAEMPARRRKAGTRAVAKPAEERSTASGGRQEAGLLPRGFALLEALIREERPLTSTEIGELVGLNSSTTHRLLQALSQIGYITRDPAKRYYPTARALFPISLYHPLNALRRAASEELRELRQAFGMTTALQIFLGTRRIVLEVMLGNEPFTPYYQTEVTAPIHATASGKLLLSTLPPAERDRLLGPEPYKAHASATLTTRPALDRDLAAIAARGHSTTMNEMLEGLSAVAAPIWLSPRRPIGCIIVSGPTRNFDAAATARIVEALKRSAELFSVASPDIRAVARFLGI